MIEERAPLTRLQQNLLRDARDHGSLPFRVDGQHVGLVTRGYLTFQVETQSLGITPQGLVRLAELEAARPLRSAEAPQVEIKATGTVVNPPPAAERVDSQASGQSTQDPEEAS